MGGYFETYRGVVVSSDDPMNESRVEVEVPEVSTEPMWAAAEQSSATRPAVGDQVWIRYESGSPDHPIWTTEPGTSEPAGHDQSPTGLDGTYRGAALDTYDPAGYRRVLVQVPELSSESMWAMPETADAALPAVGDEVWVRYEGGSPDHPVWSGGSGGGQGDAAGLSGGYQGIVVDNHDPGGYGRLAVEVPEIWPGHTTWASPAHDALPAPEIGATVAISFENGSADHPIWSPA